MSTDIAPSALAALATLMQRGIHPRGATADSRAVRPGDVFVALPGARADGRRFIADALLRGAVSVFAEADGIPADADAGEPPLSGLRPPLFLITGLAAQCGALAAAIHHDPTAQLWLAAVTGTNGKTSVSQWIAQALGASGTPCGVIGTLGSGMPGTLLSDALNTTPDALSLQARLAGFVNDGVRACAIEASSIGIEQGRLNAARVAVAVFTNLTRDHLDYHGTMERYAAAKARLFAWEGLQAAVINAEDALGQELLGSVNSTVRRIAYALHPVAVPAGTELLVPSSLDFSGSGLRFVLKGVDFTVPVVGRFNLANLLAVIGTLQCRGMALDDIAAAVACLQPPPGRMQAVGGDGEPLLVVDYAHTPDALGQVLETLRAAATARGGALVCVFGCGGDRDPGKRPLMGAIAQQRADRVWITSDNPRSEEPQRIADDILSGVVAGNAVHLCLDRAEAIRRATLEAGPEDVIVLAGKGHEPYQEIAGVRQPFSDLEQAKSALVTRRLAVSHGEQTA